MPARALRSAESAISISLHQLHQLRAALHRHPRALPTTARTPRCRRGRWMPIAMREYHDPANRRFHAQPVACPQVRAALPSALRTTKPIEGDEAIRRAVELLREGKIVAVKGLGGYHLACDARNAAAVSAHARAQVSQGEAVRGDGQGCRRSRDRSWRLSPEVGGAAEICRAPDRAAPKRRSICRASRPTMTSSASCFPTRRCIICCSPPAPPRCW